MLVKISDKLAGDWWVYRVACLGQGIWFKHFLAAASALISFSLIFVKAVPRH